MSHVWINNLVLDKKQIVTIKAQVQHFKNNLKDRNGDPYLAMTLQDRTGTISAKRWKVTSKECEATKQIRYALITGIVDEYQNNLQIIIDKPIENIGVPDDLSDFIPSSPIPFDELKARLNAHIASVHDHRLRTLLEAIFFKHKLAPRFMTYPAAKGNHHAYRHGLLQHTLEVTDTVAAIIERQHHWGARPINRDLAITGALLHDFGKTEEMAENEFDYVFSDEGSLLGHISLGQVRIAREIARLNQKAKDYFPPKLETLLLHLIVSHHGKGEWGSPRSPMTPEALVIHTADMFSAEHFYFEEARLSAKDDERTVWQRKLSGDGKSDGRHVFVWDADEIVLTASSFSLEPRKPEVVEPSGYPIPQEFRLPVLWILDADDEEYTHSARSLPLIGKIAAGEPLLHSDNLEGDIRVDCTGLGKARGDLYLLRIKGDSMTGDDIQDGDLVVVRQQEDADHGDLVVALLDGEGATVKRFIHRNGEVVLQPSNPLHPPISVPVCSRLNIQGRVIAIVRSHS